MTLSVDVPEKLVLAMGFPRDEVAAELKKEMALGLYQRGVLSAGKASQLAEMERWDFEEMLAARRIEGLYSLDDLERDLKSAEDHQRSEALNVRHSESR